MARRAQHLVMIVLPSARQHFSKRWGGDTRQVRDGDLFAPLPLRQPERIAPQEYRAAAMMVLDDAVSISREELIVQTARLLGFDRTGPDLKNAGQIALEHQIIRRAS